MRRRDRSPSYAHGFTHGAFRRARSLLAGLALVALVAACSNGPLDAGDGIVLEYVQTKIQGTTEVKHFGDAPVNGTFTLALRDNPRFTEAHFHVDDPTRDDLPSHVDADAPYTMDLDTRELSDGVHNLTVVARTDQGRPALTSVVFTVDNVADGGQQDRDGAAAPEEGVDDAQGDTTGSTEAGDEPAAGESGDEATDPAVASDLPAATLYVSPHGSDGNDGRSVGSALRTVGAAAERVGPGDVVYLAGGVYPIDVRFTASGTASEPITWTSAPGEWAIFDGSDQTPIESGHRFHVAGARHNVFMNLEVRNGPREGIWVEGAHDNVFRGIVTHGHQYSGIGNYASDRNLYEGITTYDNFDDQNPRGLYGDDADGIALSSGDSNVVRRVVTYGNSDDGIDAWRSTNTLIEYVVAFDNGRGSHGNGNGIKAGGNSEWNDTVVRHSIAYGNKANGFDDNSGLGILFENNTAFDNGGYSFMGGDTTTRRNNIAVGGIVGMWGARDSSNSWNLGLGDPRFASTDPSSDAFLSLASGSPAIGAGVDGTDLGAIPYATDYAGLIGPRVLGVASLRGDELALRRD